ncbi:GatB/YqeY domain-containing protein [Propionibacteriaceae bacterium Y1700]|uniref:GatB/YqeY domain-containing protein n=1 Tax=Microlunatus sp. Y1700 TaxID=3418487 RepID=UPI003DA7548E
MTQSQLKQQLRTDMTAAMKARDEVRVRTIRMVIAAISEAEVAGKEATELTDGQVLDVVVKETKKRREAEREFDNAGRPELAEKERQEAAVLADYLPAQLSEEEIATIVSDAIASTESAGQGMRAMGKVMGVVTPATKGRADGSAVAAEVKRQLAG